MNWRWRNLLTEIILLFDVLQKNSTGQYVNVVNQKKIRAKLQKKTIVLDDSQSDQDYLKNIDFKIQKYNWDNSAKKLLYKDQIYKITAISEYETDLVITAEEAQNE